MENNTYHTPVLLEESIRLLQIDPEGVYIDGTLGEGGHSYEIFKKLSNHGKLFSFDHDPDAISFVTQKFQKEIETGSWILINDNFAKMTDYISEATVDGIILDLGFSSRQLEIPGRGISYKESDSPLDMRMDPKLGVTAADLLKVLNEDQLTQLFREFGEVNGAKRIARQIKASDKPITTVGELNNVINRAMPAASSEKYPSRKIFQALRIAVNDELGSLQSGLSSGLSSLSYDGRFVVISFHSLEDRIVKQFFKGNSEQLAILTPKPLTPSEKEIEQNPRSSSAKLRAAEKK